MGRGKFVSLGKPTVPYLVKSRVNIACVFCPARSKSVYLIFLVFRFRPRFQPTLNLAHSYDYSSFKFYVTWYLAAISALPFSSDISLTWQRCSSNTDLWATGSALVHEKKKSNVTRKQTYNHRNSTKNFIPEPWKAQNTIYHRKDTCSI